ncbi:MAG: LysM domain-containing protein [bacterium]|nr:LysM domain-containing protein [bacterium]MCY3925494.1 LysM domain-containing protein [bacterium]
MRTASPARFLLAGLSVGLALTLTACFGGDDDLDGPTTDGGASGNTVVTLAPQPPVTQTTGVIQQPQNPTTTQPPPPPTTQQQRDIGGELVYTIEQGDTLYSIARQFDVSVDALIALNNIENPDVIRAGDQLFIPPPE